MLGQQFGAWTVLERVVGTRPARWRCRCSCGALKDVRGDHLRYGKTTSCGCLRSVKVAASKTIHGYSDSRTYRIWRGMITRCENINAVSYPLYGGKGIGVCVRWHVFQNFYSDMGDAPAGMSIDRIDNDKGYEPDNCRWATRVEQANNKSNNVRFTYEGKTMTLPEWAVYLGVPQQRLRNRMFRGWPVDKILSVSTCTNQWK